MKVLTIFFSLFFTTQLLAQEVVTLKTAHKKAVQAYRDGDLYNRRENHPKAIELLSKAIKKEPTFVDAYLLRADSYQALKQYEKSEQDFEKVISITDNFKPRLYYVLALVEYRAQKYEEAIPHMEKYLTFPKQHPKIVAKAKKYLATFKFSAQAVKNPVPFDPVNLGENINSRHAEYLPSLTIDGNTLIYTVRLGSQEDFFISSKVDDKWQPRQNLGEPINTDDNEGAQTISADGKILVYTVCNRHYDFGSCDLYISELKKGRWTRPQNIGQPINSAAWESQPSLSADGTALYFTSNNGKGKGGKDIWVSKRQANGKWSAPESLNINTKGHEESPFIHPDGQTLYFMSTGYPGMGGSDIYFARKQADGTWGKPQNIGYPINTLANEGALIVSLDGKTAYFASDKKGGFGAVDIYSFELHEQARPLPVTYVKAVVYDEKTKKRLKAKVEIVDLATGNTHSEAMTDVQGEFLVCLPLGQEYALNVNKKTYLFHSENFDLKEISSRDEPFLLEIGLQKIPPKEEIVTTNPTAPVIPKSKPIILKNIFFASGSAVLKPTSKTELNRLKALLDENPTINIQINGHTDNVGSDTDNLQLSNDRAKAVVNYLIKNGIVTNRLRSKGFGETQPIDSNDTEDGRRNNRRTEFEVF